MGCASSQEKQDAVPKSPGEEPVAGKQKQVTESENPKSGAPKEDDSPKYVKVHCSIPAMFILLLT